MEVEFKKQKNTYAKIKFLLESVPELSNDIDRLIFTFYFYELGQDKVNQMSGYDLFMYFNSKFKEKIPKIDTISRIGRLILQRNPHLKSPIEEPKTILHNPENVQPVEMFKFASKKGRTTMDSIFEKLNK
jgi:hypothetical protein